MDLPQQTTTPRAMALSSGSANMVLDQPTLQLQRMLKLVLSLQLESRQRITMALTTVSITVFTMMPTMLPWLRTTHTLAISMSLCPHTEPLSQQPEDIILRPLDLESTLTDMTTAARPLRTTKRILSITHVYPSRKLFPYLMV
jgi:hypothetical protein